MNRLLLSGLIFLLLAGEGCEKRDRINPFDPENPDTGGVPFLLDARAGDSRTELEWEPADLAGIVAVRIERRDPENQIIDLSPDGLDPGLKRYTDLTPANGTEYAYRLELELHSGARLLTEWDAATPGDAIPWVVDSDGGGLSRITPDARDRLLQVRSGYWFLDLAVDTTDASVWSVDYLDGFLYQHDFDGTELLRVSVAGARAVDVDRIDGRVWVGSFDRQLVERVNRSGEVDWLDAEAGSVEDLLAVSAGGIWLCNREGEIRIYGEDQLLGSVAGFDMPVALAHSEEGRVLLLERGSGEVRRFDEDGGFDLASNAELIEPLDLCSDGDRGAWVADIGREGLVHLDDRLFEVGFVPFPGILGVTWDDRDSLLWVAGGGRVEIRSADGEFVSGQTIGPRPLKIELTHSPVPE